MQVIEKVKVDRHAHHEPCDDGLVHPAGKPHRTSFRWLRCGAVRHDGQRAAHLRALIPRLRFQYLRFGVFHGAQQWHSQRAHFVPAHARHSGRRGTSFAKTSRHQRHLARHHRGRSAHTDRHRNAFPPRTEKIPLRIKQIIQTAVVARTTAAVLALSDGLWRNNSIKFYFLR